MCLLYNVDPVAKQLSFFLKKVVLERYTPGRVEEGGGLEGVLPLSHWPYPIRCASLEGVVLGQLGLEKVT